MSKENTIKIIYKKVNKVPKIMEIKNDLETKQKLVGGLIEVVPYINNTLIICNEEGKLLNLSENVRFTNDYIAGDFIVVGDDFGRAGFKSLTIKEIDSVMKDLSKRCIKYKENELEM